MSELPTGWAWASLGEVGDWRGGGTPSKRRQDFWESGTIPWLSPKDMRADVISDTVDHITADAVSKSAVSIIPEGSVAIVVRSGILERRVPTASVPFETTLNQDMKAIVPFGGIMHQWIRYCIQHNESRILRECRKDGTTVASLDTAKLMQLPIPIAPPREQERIVRMLEESEEALARPTKVLGEISTRVNALGIRLVDDAILGRSIGADTAEASSPLSGRYERFSYDDLPALPRGWQWRLASDVCDSINSGSTPSADLMTAGQGDIPFLKVYNLHKNGYVDFSKNPTYVSFGTHRGKLARSICRPGDVLTNIVGPPLGKSAVVPDQFSEWNINQAIVSFRAGSELLPRWLATCLGSRFLTQLLTGTARATAGQFNIALSTCRDVPLPIPPINSQEAILDELDQIMETVRRCTSAIREISARVYIERRSVLRSALAGTLTEQDAADEPADAVLSNIRASRESATAKMPRKALSRKASQA